MLEKRVSKMTNQGFILTTYKKTSTVVGLFLRKHRLKVRNTREFTGEHLRWVGLNMTDNFQHW